MLENLFKLSPYIRLAGMQGSDDWPHRDRLIYDHQILYCIQGQGYLVLDGIEYKIKEGDILVIRPNVPHRYIQDRDNPCESFWFHLDWFYRDDYDWPTKYYEDKTSYWRLFDGLLHYPEHIRPEIVLGENYNLPDVIQTKNKNFFHDQFETIYYSYLSLKDTWQLKANAAFYKILYGIYSDEIKEIVDNLDKYTFQVNKMLRFIEDNYQNNINTTQIANQGFYSPDYACKIFKEKTGKTVSKYLFEYRLEKAKELFLNMELSIADIAYMCGFNSETYFSVAIKKNTGLTPTQLRDKVFKSVNPGEL